MQSSCPYTWSRPRAPWRGHLVTSGTDYCPCSHLEQVEAVSADVGEAGEGCGVVKASAEIIIYIYFYQDMELLLLAREIHELYLRLCLDLR